MINATESEVTSLNLIDYADPVVADKMANGRMNTPDRQILEHIRSSIRRGLPQMRPGPVRPERICLVGSGPSLADSFDTLRQMVWEGAILVTVNGAYHYCRERNLRPNTQIVMDARAANARFLTPETPNCRYVLASQCAPELFDQVAGYPNVWIFHPVVKKEGPASDLLDAYYGGNWMGIGGGTTVATRAISMLRLAGYVRFDLFGIDCCWREDVHHILPQPENAKDRWSVITASVKGSSLPPRKFKVSGWMLKQVEDLMSVMKVNGQHFTLVGHGDSLFTYLVEALGAEGTESISLTPSSADGSTVTP